MARPNKLILILLIGFFLSCQNPNRDLNTILSLSEENRPELETAIQHYSSPSDSLKKQAVIFLIKNMTYHYGLEGHLLDQYDTLFSEVQRIKKQKTLVQDPNIGLKIPEVDSIWKQVGQQHGALDKNRLTIKPDLQNISSDFLIENVEYAFKAWEFPWSRHLNFEEFCRYILPYRFRDERLQSWRPIVFRKYQKKIDSLIAQNVTDPLTVCRLVNKELSTSWQYSHTLNQYPIAMGLDNLLKAEMGSCTHNTELAVYVMRALGIAVTHEQVPHYANRKSGHDFNGVMDAFGKFHDFEIGNPKIGDVVETRKRQNYVIPKIYRQSSIITENSLAILKDKNEKIPSDFSNPRMIDVTAQYMPVSDLKVLLNKNPSETKYLYLCVFNNQTWVPVAWAVAQKSGTVFKDMGRGVTYVPMYFKNGRFLPASDPVILREDGIKEVLRVQDHPQKITLTRKYKPRSHLMGKMPGGIFQGSNDPDFGSAQVLYQVKDTLPMVYHRIPVKAGSFFRYIRYIFPQDREGSLAELSVSANGKELLTKEIFYRNLSKRAAEKAFDRNPLSFIQNINLERKSWVGIDLGKSKNITHLKFCPRTDKNHIWPGLTYELFYWNEGWKSLGVKTADEHKLTFNSPVSGALYLLKCLDEGTEERIFTIENGNQRWW